MGCSEGRREASGDNAGTLAQGLEGCRGFLLLSIRMLRLGRQETGIDGSKQPLLDGAFCLRL